MKRLIVGLSGSPRAEANTDAAVRQALRAAEEQGLDTLFLAIRDYDLEPCSGCRACMELGECRIKDRLDELMEPVRKAAALVIGSPVYWWSPPGVMKDFMDRTHGWFVGGGIFRDQAAAILSVAADSGFEAHERPIEVWLEHYGAQVVAKEHVYARDKGDFEAAPEEQEKCRSAGQAVAAATGLR
ncbi:MAG: flavodoxin family protein [Armatimonadota bacterium]